LLRVLLHVHFTLLGFVSADKDNRLTRQEFMTGSARTVAPAEGLGDALPGCAARATCRVAST
jgi:hypothetical protein